MYQAHFGLRRRPFAGPPPPARFVPSGSQAAALDELVDAIGRGPGVGLVLGEAGTGKTLVCHRLVHALDRSVTGGVVSVAATATPRSLLQAVVHAFGLDYRQLDLQELRLALNDLVIDQDAAGRPLLLVIDEAQNLTFDLLDEVRLLVDPRPDGREGVRLVLAGQPALGRVLGRRAAGGLDERVTIRVRVEGLGRAEAADYLARRLDEAGGARDRLFDAEAVAALWRRSAGIPRRLDRLADAALVAAYKARARRVERAHVTGSPADLARPEPGPARPIEPEDQASQPPAGSGHNRLDAMAEPAGPADPDPLERSSRDPLDDPDPAPDLSEDDDPSFIEVGWEGDWAEMVEPVNGTHRPDPIMPPLESQLMATVAPARSQPVLDPMGEEYDEEELVIDPLAALKSAEDPARQVWAAACRSDPGPDAPAPHQNGAADRPFDPPGGAPPNGPAEYDGLFRQVSPWDRLEA